MVDSNDSVRLKEAMGELEVILQNREMKDALLLVFANKQDIPTGESMSISDIWSEARMLI